MKRVWMFSPRNTKWRKLNWPKLNYSHLSQSGENMTTPKYGVLNYFVSMNFGTRCHFYIILTRLNYMLGSICTRHSTLAKCPFERSRHLISSTNQRYYTRQKNHY